MNYRQTQKSGFLSTMSEEDSMGLFRKRLEELSGKQFENGYNSEVMKLLTYYEGLAALYRCNPNSITGKEKKELAERAKRLERDGVTISDKEVQKLNNEGNILEASERGMIHLRRVILANSMSAIAFTTNVPFDRERFKIISTELGKQQITESESSTQKTDKNETYTKSRSTSQRYR
jgi:hypothetical protein